MLRNGWYRVLVAASLALLAAGSFPGARAEDKPSIEPRAEKILTLALAKLAAAQNFTFRAEIANDTPLPSGQKIQFSGTLESAVRRPNGFWSRLDGEQRQTQTWFDGTVFTFLDVEKNIYATSQVPGRLDELFDTMREKLGFTPPLSLLLHEKVAQEALTNVSLGFYVGRGVVRGVPCHHLAFRAEKVDWQIWVAETGDPVIERVVITYKQSADSPQYVATFLEWDFNAALSDSRFAFKAPPGAVQCEFQDMKK